MELTIERHTFTMVNYHVFPIYYVQYLSFLWMSFKGNQLLVDVFLVLKREYNAFGDTDAISAID